MKRKHRKKKKSGLKKVLLLLALVGVGIGLLSVFEGELTDAVRPWLKRRGLLEQKKEVTLYFSDREAEYLIGEKRGIKQKEDVEAEARELIQELIKGPKRKLLPTLPSRTKLLSLHLDDKGMAKVNFSKALSKDHPGGSSAEMVTVYSVVNSLAFNFPNIKRVQFLVEGREIDTITGHLSISKSVSPRPDLIKKSSAK
jgi:spore germination protein GerM